jgi:hypothetical protein
MTSTQNTADKMNAFLNDDIDEVVSHPQTNPNGLSKEQMRSMMNGTATNGTAKKTLSGIQEHQAMMLFDHDTGTVEAVIPKGTPKSCAGDFRHYAHLEQKKFAIQYRLRQKLANKSTK